MTDGQTDGPTELRWLRRAIAVPAVAHKKTLRCIEVGYNRFGPAHDEGHRLLYHLGHQSLWQTLVVLFVAQGRMAADCVNDRLVISLLAGPCAPLITGLCDRWLSSKRGNWTMVLCQFGLLLVSQTLKRVTKIPKNVKKNNVFTSMKSNAYSKSRASCMYSMSTKIESLITG